MARKPRKSSGKETSETVASLAGRVLEGYDPSRDEIERLAASALAQTQPRAKRAGDKPSFTGKRTRGKAIKASATA